MPRPRLKHMVVILPGITGSVLKKDGDDIWAFSGQAIRDALFHKTSYLESLKIAGDDDGTLDDLGDGVTATALMRNASLVPGLIKLFDGYNGLGEMIRGRFEVVGAGTASKEPSNLFEAPYDWRRHNAAASRMLKRLVDERLAQWRKYTYDKDAKVILLAHSMGGIVARHYLEVREGWRDCLALVTFGTPYQGSLNALNFLANGYKKKVIDLSACLRSFPSIYQLLPTYPVVKLDGPFRDVASFNDLPGVEQARARAAAEFHAQIERKVADHRMDATYLTDGYKILPFVGTRQSTLQSAKFDGTTVTVGGSLPECVHELLGEGDGTVPRYSAMPPELANEFRETFVPEKHGSLQASGIVLDDLLGRLEQMQVPMARAVRGPELAVERGALSLDVEDMYVSGEPVEFRAALVNQKSDAGGVVGQLRPAAGGSAETVSFTRAGDEWVARIASLPAGLYRIEVRTEAAYPVGPPPVHDVFEVEG